MKSSLQLPSDSSQPLKAAVVRADADFLAGMLLKQRLKAFKDGRQVVVISGRRVGKTALQKALVALKDRGPICWPLEGPKMPLKP